MNSVPGINPPLEALEMPDYMSQGNQKEMNENEQEAKAVTEED